MKPPRQDLERSAVPVMPFRFLSQLRASFPQFAEQGRTGAYSQQDAEECWSQLLYTLRERLRARPGPAPLPWALPYAGARQSRPFTEER